MIGPADSAWAVAARRLRTSAALLLFVGVAALLAAAVLSPASSPVLGLARIPPCWAVVFPCAAALVGICMRASANRWFVAFAVTGLLASSWFVVAIQPLGDHGMWRVWATTDRLAASEVLGNLVHRLVRIGFGERALQFVAPVVGVLATLAWFSFGERALVPLVEASARARLRAFLAVVPALGGSGLVFHRDYVENPATSLPFLWLGLGSLCVHVRSGGGERQHLVRAAAWLALATLAHGMNAPVLVAAGCCGFVRDGATLRTGLRDLGILVAMAAAVAGVVLGSLHACGFPLEVGHAQGGGDGRLFVPLRRDEAHAFGLFDLAHARAAGQALLAAGPFALAALAARWRPSELARVRDLMAATPPLVLAACGSVLLTFLLHFDLGFPHDLDLMIGVTAPLAPGIVVVLANGPLRTTGWLACGLALVHAFALAGGLLVPHEPASPMAACAAGTAEADALTANGRARVCDLRADERVVYRLLAPAGALAPIAYAVFVHRGIPAESRAPGRACFALPGEPGHDASRTIVLCDGLTGSAAMLPPFASSLTTPPMPAPTTPEPHVVQALLRDAAGREWTTNAVVVRLGP